MEQVRWLSEIGSLLSDQSRSAMLMLMMNGRAYTASELARAANIAASTASHHLERMRESGLLEQVRQGRHRYFRIADDNVAGFIEQALGTYAALDRQSVTTRCPVHLRTARLCYNHLAGELGVRLLTTGLDRAVFIMEPDCIRPGTAASPFFAALQLDPDTCGNGRPCLDWSERRFHLAGKLGTSIAEAMLAQRWLLSGTRRQVTVTEKGRQELARYFGI